MTRWRVSASLLSVILGTGCSAGDDRATGVRSRSAPANVVVAGETVEVAELTEAVAGLCLARREAATDPPAAKATYDQRSRGGIETAGRALERSYSLQAASIAEARTLVEADLAADPPRPTVGLHLARLTETMRAGLARLGVPTSPCEM